MEAATWNAAPIVTRVRAGDDTAASELYNGLYPLVLRIVRAHRSRRVPEEDLVQAVFMRVFGKLDQFSGTVPLEHWVSRIAVNTCRKQLAYERRRPELRWSDLTEPEEQVIRTLATAAGELPTVQAMAARELVDKLLERLTPADRLVITLLHLEGRSVQEVRQATGWSGPLVKVRAFRARRRMKQHLNELMQEIPP